jgi:hypothetical protein
VVQPGATVENPGGQIVECPDATIANNAVAYDFASDTLVISQRRETLTRFATRARGAAAWTTEARLDPEPDLQSKDVVAALTTSDNTLRFVADVVRDNFALAGQTFRLGIQPRVFRLEGAAVALGSVPALVTSVTLPWLDLTSTPSGRSYGVVSGIVGGRQQYFAFGFEANGQPATAFGAAGLRVGLSAMSCIFSTEIAASDSGAGLVLAASGATGSFCTNRTVEQAVWSPQGVLTGLANSGTEPAGQSLYTAGLSTLADGRMLTAPIIAIDSARALVQVQLITNTEIKKRSEFSIPLPTGYSVGTTGEHRTDITPRAAGGAWLTISGGSHLIVQALDSNYAPVALPQLVSADMGRVIALREATDGSLLLAMRATTRNAANEVTGISVSGVSVITDRLAMNVKLLSQDGLAVIKRDGTLIAMGVSGGASTRNALSFVSTQWTNRSWTAATQELAAAPMVEPRLTLDAAILDASEAVLVALRAQPLDALGANEYSAGVTRYTFGAVPTTPGASTLAIGFFNTAINHFFVTSDTAEAAGIDRGAAGAGWQRTADDFRVWQSAATAPANAKPVCRFYGTPGVGPNSHFYTANAAECDAVKRDRGWTFEGIAFYVLDAVDGACTTGSRPVYRFYNNGFARNDSNHRYSVDSSAMPAPWTREGVVFCSPIN